MKTLIYLFTIMSLAMLITACGGKTETKENETKQAPTTASSANNSVSPPTKQTDGGADDVRSANTNSQVRSNTNGQDKKDADDIRRSNTNQRKIDRDDSKENRPANSRRDSDDSGKRESDGDSDDN